MATQTTNQPAAGANGKDSKALSVTAQRRLTLRNVFEQQRPELVKLLPKGMDPDRLFRMALTECIKNADLLKCTAESWALAIQTCAQQGLYPDSGLGYMYLVPRKNKKKQADGTYVTLEEVSAMRGYQGDIRLARNSGEIADIYAEVVYAKDTYKVTKGLSRNIVHEPYDGDDDPGPLKACYAVAKLTSDEVAFVTLTKADVMRHKASSQGSDSDFSPWKKHEAAMWKKTAIHELAKWLPKSTEAMERAVRAIGGEAAIDITPVLTATVPVEPACGLEGITANLQAANAAQDFGPECARCGQPEPPCDAQDDEGRAFHGHCLDALKKEREEMSRAAQPAAREAGADDGPAPQQSRAAQPARQARQSRLSE
jgi:recombination protein RecT